MPRARKYLTDAERQHAYRLRKSERDEKMRRELERLKPAKAGKAKRNVTTSDDDLRPKLRVLRARIKRRPKNAARAELVELIDSIKNELDRLIVKP